MHTILDVPSDVFTHDACIVEEQAEHIVLAVRIPREMVQRNMHFLAALSDRLGPDAPKEPRTFALPKTGRRVGGRNLQFAAWAALAACGILATGAVSYAVMVDASPAMMMKSFSAVNPKIAYGDPLIVAMVGRRDRFCPTDVIRTVARAKDGVEIYRIREPGSGWAPSDSFRSMRVLVRLPGHITPGAYQYTSTAVSTCADGTHWTSSNSLNFEVVKS